MYRMSTKSGVQLMAQAVLLLEHGRTVTDTAEASVTAGVGDDELIVMDAVPLCV